MKKRQLTVDNHYVPQSYLARWSNDRVHVSCYRVLVSHPSVPLWDPQAIRGIAYHPHLYTRLVEGEESDDVEHWLGREFETPAAPVIERMITGDRLDVDDWRCVIRYLAAQDARTPARFCEFMQRSESLPHLLDEVLTDSAARLEQTVREGRSLEKVAPQPSGETLPIRVSLRPSADGANGELHAQASVGRQLWLWSVKHLLNTTWEALLQHRWTVVHCPPGMTWLTSDNPVVRLNFHAPHRYDFNGGWGSVGTEIFMPLGPHHLLYTQVGARRVPVKGSVASEHMAAWVQRCIAQNAYRFVFAASPHPTVTQWRPRTVDGAAYAREHEQWMRWHAEQCKAERDLAR